MGTKLPTYPPNVKMLPNGKPNPLYDPSHKRKTMRCDECRFWTNPDDDGVHGICRRLPPHLDDRVVKIHQLWWCGEFEPKAEPIERTEAYTADKICAHVGNVVLTSDSIGMGELVIDGQKIPRVRRVRITSETGKENLVEVTIVPK